MPTLRETATRNDAAKDLLGLEAQGIAAISQLKAVKTNLFALKETVGPDDAADVQAVIATLAASIQTDLLGG